MFKIKNKGYKVGQVLHGWRLADLLISIKVNRIDKEYAYCSYDDMLGTFEK